MTSFDPAIRQQCERELESLRSADDGILAVILATRDGEPFCGGYGEQQNDGKLAAMCASLVTFGESVMRAFKTSGLNHVLLEGIEGKLVVINVPWRDGFVLAILAGKEARVGMVLGQAVACVRRLVKIFAYGRRKERLRDE